MTARWRKLAAGRGNRLPSRMEMSAKPTLVVHFRRTDGAGGDGSFGARADRLRREGATSACEGASGAARKGTGGRFGKSAADNTGKGARVSVQEPKRET